jgi:hypothetical protein
MKIQFGIRTMFVAITIGAIWAEAVVLGCQVVNYRLPQYYLRSTLPIYAINAASESPLWAPMLVLFYAAGRRSIGVGTVAAVVIAEAVALLASWIVCPLLPTAG